MLHELKVSVHPSFGLEVNTLSLAQSRHVHPRPELASLVQVDGKAKGVVLVVPPGLVSCQSLLLNMIVLQPSAMTSS